MLVALLGLLDTRTSPGSDSLVERLTKLVMGHGATPDRWRPAFDRRGGAEDRASDR